MLVGILSFFFSIFIGISIPLLIRFIVKKEAYDKRTSAFLSIVLFIVFFLIAVKIKFLSGSGLFFSLFISYYILRYGSNSEFTKSIIIDIEHYLIKGDKPEISIEKALLSKLVFDDNEIKEIISRNYNHEKDLYQLMGIVSSSLIIKHYKKHGVPSNQFQNDALMLSIYNLVKDIMKGLKFKPTTLKYFNVSDIDREPSN